jgi:hypothetical protein
LSIFRLLFGAFTLVLVASCATLSKSECEQADWQTIGLEDGARGRVISYIGEHRKACAEHGIKPDLAQYQNGHDAGVRQYCTPQNGFDQGHAGRSYNNVCPADLEGLFLAGFDTGRELHQLDVDIHQKEREVHDMQHELEDLVGQQQLVETRLLSTSLTAVERKALLDQFKQQQTGITQLEIDIRDTELGAAHKQGVFDLLNNSHPYQ